MERTLCIIKPDAVASGYVGDILKRIQAEGLKILGLRMLKLSQEQAEAFYAVHRERPFFKDLVAFMTSGPIVVAALEAPQAISQYRKLMGATDPAKAEKNTLRKLYAKDIQNNAVHGSDGPETARNEVPFFFSSTDLVA